MNDISLLSLEFSSRAIGKCRFRIRKGLTLVEMIRALESVLYRISEIDKYYRLDLCRIKNVRESRRLAMPREPTSAFALDLRPVLR